MGIFDLIFPKICVGCGRWGSYFCPGCVLNIKQGDLVCPTCERLSIGGKVHPLCKKRYGLDGLWSLGIYHNPLRKAIQKLKYRFVSDIAEKLVDLMIEYWARFAPQVLEEIKKDQGENWVVVPVPLHPKREKFRGFNQSALIGQLLSNKLGLGYCEYLNRIRYTKPQVGMDSKERKVNIRGAFAFSSTKRCTQEANILLVDDVWTTGSTLRECCYILKRGGAKKVWAITLAR